MRASTFFWMRSAKAGKYSPFDTIWVGTGVGADAASAPATRRCSRSLSQLPSFVLLFGDRPVAGPLTAGGYTRICPNHDAEFPSGLDYDPVCWNGAAIEDNEPAVLLARQSVCNVRY